MPPGGVAVTAAAGVLTTLLVLSINAGRFVTAPLRTAGLLWPVYLGLLVLGVAALAGTGRWRRTPVWGLPAFWFVGLGWMPYAWRVAPDPEWASREVLLLSYCAVLSTAALLLGRRASLAWWRRGWVLSLVLAGAVAVWEMTTAQHLWVHPWPFQPRIAVATYGNPNNFGIVTLAMLVAVLAWRAESRSRAVRAGLGVAAVACAAFAILSESRSAVLGLVLVALLDVSRRLAAHPGLVRATVAAHRRVAATLAVLVGMLAVASFVVPALAARNPLVRMIHAALQPETAASDLFRVRVSLLGLRYWRESGFLGTGAGSFEPIMWNDPASGIEIEANLHNAFVELLMQYGVVVFAAFALLLLVLVRVWWTTRLAARLRPRVGIVRTELAGHLLVFAALGLTASSALTLTVWWLVLANACACGARLLDLRAPRDRRGPQEVSAPGVGGSAG
ncbi:O-antigen ligase family protein [Mobilicoccus pelagius]|nr:O-antigen ligase family protein [Mobilicoccus pelagius]